MKYPTALLFALVSAAGLAASGCASQPSSTSQTTTSPESTVEVESALSGTPCARSADCNDSNPCTRDTCLASTHTCRFTATAEGSTCADSDACTTHETCTSGVCTGPTLPACISGASCSSSSECDDHNPCTRDVCRASSHTCFNTVLDDGSACEMGCRVEGTCAAGYCEGTHVGSDGTACNDGNACTQTDACTSGICAGSNKVVCAAAGECQQAGYCLKSSGACRYNAKADGTACTDGDACTQSDTCAAGACVGASPVVCPASDQCHAAATCDSGGGGCSAAALADGTGCDDGNPGTSDDVCTAGVCAGTGVVACTPASVTFEVRDASCYLPGTYTFTAGAVELGSMVSGGACDCYAPPTTFTVTDPAIVDAVSMCGGQLSYTFDATGTEYHTIVAYVAVTVTSADGLSARRCLFDAGGQGCAPRDVCAGGYETVVTGSGGADMGCPSCAPCPDGTTRCGESCVDALSDEANCGACGAACPVSQTCEAGTCACDGSLMACGAICVDANSDMLNCGSCGIACPGGGACVAGHCECPVGQTDCSGTCIDTSTDLLNCGGCNAGCHTNEQCAAGTCECVPGFESCNGACVDPLSDEAHCGACNAPCDTGYVCDAGACACAPGTSVCEGSCVNTGSDPSNCGGCGVVCGAEAPYCGNGTCTNAVLITQPNYAFGHHGQCAGWNDCGDAATCAQWACWATGHGALVSHGEDRPCTEFSNCSLIHTTCVPGDCAYEANWGNWCEVAGVTDIYCTP